MSKKSEYPLHLKRAGLTVSIYRQVRDAGRECFVVSYYQGGQRHRPTFGTAEEARADADLVLKKHAQGQMEVLQLSGTDRLAYVRAQEVLAPLKITVDAAAAEYARARQLLNGEADLIEAVRFYLNSSREKFEHKRVEDVVRELLETREQDGSTKVHVDDLRSRLTPFAAAFACDVHRLEPRLIENFLLKIKGSPRTKINYRTAISNFLSFARSHKYCPSDFNPLNGIARIKNPAQDVEIYTPQEMALLLKHAPQKLLAYMAIAGFAGLRQSEIVRLDWEEHIIKDRIRVPPHERERKKSANRIVPIQPNLQEWLARCGAQAGPVVPYKNVSNELVGLAQKVGLESKHNGLRHSYGSYRLAVLQDAEKVAHEMGNSKRMVLTHYNNPTHESEGQTWFSIAPGTIDRFLQDSPAGSGSGNEVNQQPGVSIQAA